MGPFGSVSSFGDTLLTIPNNAWVNFVKFSPSSNLIAFSTQDCEMNFAKVSEAADGKAKIKPVKILLRINPILTGTFLGEDKFVAAGFDKVPFLFKQEGKDWKQVKELDEGMKNIRKAKISGNKFLDTKVYFNPDIKLNASIMMKENDTKHVNYINCLKTFASEEGKPTILSTSDPNGYLNWWNVKDL
jgi:hypothetical protein